MVVVMVQPRHGATIVVRKVSWRCACAVLGAAPVAQKLPLVLRLSHKSSLALPDVSGAALVARKLGPLLRPPNTQTCHQHLAATTTTTTTTTIVNTSAPAIASPRISPPRLERNHHQYRRGSCPFLRSRRHNQIPHACLRGPSLPDSAYDCNDMILAMVIVMAVVLVVMMMVMIVMMALQVSCICVRYACARVPVGVCIQTCMRVHVRAYTHGCAQVCPYVCAGTC